MTDAMNALDLILPIASHVKLTEQTSTINGSILTHVA